MSENTGVSHDMVVLDFLDELHQLPPGTQGMPNLDGALRDLPPDGPVQVILDEFRKWCHKREHILDLGELWDVLKPNTFNRHFRAILALLGLPLPAAGDPPLMGEYRLVEVLGVGGFGIVYLAVSKTGLKVAIKFCLPVPGLSAEEVRARFDLEKKTAHWVAALPHADQYYLTTIGEGEWQTHPFLILKYVDRAMTLHKDQHVSGRSDEEQTIKRSLSLARAVEYLHRNGLLHRDITPMNVFVVPEERVLVGDFGLAKRISAEATNGATEHRASSGVGTPGYQAPELRRGQADVRTDVWGVGAVAHFLWTGRAPEFTAKGKLVWPASHLPKDPQGLRGLIEKCLRFSPKERCQTARELVNALKELQKRASQRGEPKGGRALVVVALLLAGLYAKMDAGKRGPIFDDKQYHAEAEVKHLIERRKLFPPELYPKRWEDVDVVMLFRYEVERLGWNPTPEGLRRVEMLFDRYFELCSIGKVGMHLNMGETYRYAAEAAKKARAPEQETEYYTKAIAKCDAAVALDRGCAIAYVNRAIYWSRIENHREAVADVQLALLLRPYDKVRYYAPSVVLYAAVEVYVALARSRSGQVRRDILQGAALQTMSELALALRAEKQHDRALFAESLLEKIKGGKVPDEVDLAQLQNH